jgi:hypothetical protein
MKIFFNYLITCSLLVQPLCHDPVVYQGIPLAISQNVRFVLSFLGRMAEWKNRTLQFESHILCGPVQLGLAVVVSGGGASVRRLGLVRGGFAVYTQSLGCGLTRAGGGIYVSRRLGGLRSRGRAYPTGKPSH